MVIKMKHNHIFMRFPQGKEKVFTVTFDDGVVEDIEIINKLTELGLCGTFNLNSGLFKDPDVDNSQLEDDYFPIKDIQLRLTKEEARKLYAKPNIEVASHGYRHADPTMLDSAALIWDVMEDRHILEEMFGYPVTGYAYPQGGFNEGVIATLKSCGIEYARVAYITQNFSLPTDPMRLTASLWFDDARLLEFTDQFIKEETTTGAFYHTTQSRYFSLVGHGYSLGPVRNNFFAALEKIAQADNIWYATNIQIVRYMKAFNSLIYTADRSAVYNPSAQSVWIFANRQCVEIRPGETVQL